MINMEDIDFYFVTDSTLTRKGVIDDVSSALKAGVKIIQYREKNRSTKDMIEEAYAIKRLCEGRATFLVNDRVDIALAVDTDGVHLGQDDMPYDKARELLGKDKIIGITVHSVKESVESERLGANYLGASSIFATKTKVDAGKGTGLHLIQDIKKYVKIPVVAIGGINLDNVASVIQAGADSVAAISAVITKDDVTEECRRFIKIISDFKRPHTSQ
jgi:thiamine-phosphate pyrophosphorylase